MNQMFNNHNNQSPVSPMMSEPHPLTSSYFQMLNGAKNQKLESLPRSTPTHHLFMGTPTCDIYTKKKKKRGWWNKALMFFKRTTATKHYMDYNDDDDEERDVHMARARAFRAAGASMSGPLYMADTQPRHWTLVSPGRSEGGGVGMEGGSGCSSPYLSLRELNKERQLMMSPMYSISR